PQPLRAGRYHAAPTAAFAHRSLPRSTNHSLCTQVSTPYTAPTTTSAHTPALTLSVAAMFLEEDSELWPISRVLRSALHVALIIKYKVQPSPSSSTNT
ncbi:unnamed protein product, partial [Staurois parvus]